jgi:predicted NAD/FAD-dependent oxidoreductase
MLTAPGPQSVGLVKESNIVLRRQKLDALDAIRYDPCLTVIGVLDGPERAAQSRGE